MGTMPAPLIGTNKYKLQIAEILEFLKRGNALFPNMDIFDLIKLYNLRMDYNPCAVLDALHQFKMAQEAIANAESQIETGDAGSPTESA